MGQWFAFKTSPTSFPPNGLNGCKEGKAPHNSPLRGHYGYLPSSEESRKRIRKDPTANEAPKEGIPDCIGGLAIEKKMIHSFGCQAHWARFNHNQIAFPKIAQGEYPPSKSQWGKARILGALDFQRDSHWLSGGELGDRALKKDATENTPIFGWCPQRGILAHLRNIYSVKSVKESKQIPFFWFSQIFSKDWTPWNPIAVSVCVIRH